MIHDVNTRSFFPTEGMVRSQRYGEVSQEKLRHFQLDSQSLFWATAVDGEAINHIQAHVLPSLGFQVAKFGWKPHIKASEKVDYYIDIINLTEHSKSHWHYRDLYLDLVIVEGERCEVLDTDEFLAAIKAGYLEQDEIALALNSLHTLINKLAEHNYQLESYLEHNKIHLQWIV